MKRKICSMICFVLLLLSLTVFTGCGKNSSGGGGGAAGIVGSGE